MKKVKYKRKNDSESKKGFGITYKFEAWNDKINELNVSWNYAWNYKINADSLFIQELEKLELNYSTYA